MKFHNCRHATMHMMLCSDACPIKETSIAGPAKSIDESVAAKLETKIYKNIEFSLMKLKHDCMTI